MGTKDLQKKDYLYDPARFADLVNGVVCAGRQVLAASDLTELDSQTGQFSITAYNEIVGGSENASDDASESGDGIDRDQNGDSGSSTGESTRGDDGNKGHGRNRNIREAKRTNRKDRHRDLLRRAAFGVNFMVIGIENQEDTNYLMPLRCMSYDTAEYEKQAVQIRREVRNGKKGKVTKAEFLSGFMKDSRLQPCVTIVLYYGEDWDGATSLREILNLEGIPPELRDEVNDYKIHLCEVRKFENTEVFRTDVKQVFDCLRYAKDPEKLYQLVANDPAYQAMEPDTYEAIVEYTGMNELMKVKEYGEDGKVDMNEIAQGLIEMGRKNGMEQGIQQGMEQGIEQGIQQGMAQVIRGMVETIHELGSTKEEAVCRLVEKLNLSGEEAGRYVKQYWT